MNHSCRTLSFTAPRLPGHQLPDAGVLVLDKLSAGRVSVQVVIASRSPPSVDDQLQGDVFRRNKSLAESPSLGFSRFGVGGPQGAQPSKTPVAGLSWLSTYRLYMGCRDGFLPLSIRPPSIPIPHRTS